MRILCRSNPIPLPTSEGIAYSLFESPRHQNVGRVGGSIVQDVLRSGIQPSYQVWDFLAIALSVAAADHGCLRKDSPDGWTRAIQLEIAVYKPSHWRKQRVLLEQALRFLTGDIWNIKFLSGGTPPPRRRRRRTRKRISGDCVSLFSGGLDSLIGSIDLVSKGRQPVLVSQIARGDASRQRSLANSVSPTLSHLQLSHAVNPPGIAERSQRARSIVFIAYGVLAASVLSQYRNGQIIDLIIPENGFISLNIPLTPLRLGSLSTRTTHPFFIKLVQEFLDSVGFQVRLHNPYQHKTKGEMLAECLDQAVLGNLAHQTTSCGRFARFNYKHCGRCVPCLIRRAAFGEWGIEDETIYAYEDLSINDKDHRHFDDVRSAIVAALQVQNLGVEEWAAGTISAVELGDTEPYAELAKRGVEELRSFLSEVGACD